jgi:ribosomal protein L18E
VKNAKAALEAEKAKLAKIEEFVTDSFVQGPSSLWVKLTDNQSQTQLTVASLKQRIDKVKKAIAQLQTDVVVIPAKAAEGQALRDAVDVAYLQFEKASKTKEIASTTRERMRSKNKTFFRMTLEQPPEEARFADPVYPNYALFAGIGAFLGLLIGGAIAFIGEFSAASFTTPNQVRYMLQVPILGEVAPMITRYDVKKRSRRRRILLAVSCLVIVVLLVIHLMWFDSEWRANLPIGLRDILRKLYGGR